MNVDVVAGGLLGLWFGDSGSAPGGGRTPARISTSWRDPFTTGGVIPSSSDITNGGDEAVLVEVAGTDSLSAASSSSSFAFSSSTLGLFGGRVVDEVDDIVVMTKRKMKINFGVIKDNLINLI